MLMLMMMVQSMKGLQDIIISLLITVNPHQELWKKGWWGSWTDVHWHKNNTGGRRNYNNYVDDGDYIITMVMKMMMKMMMFMIMMSFSHSALKPKQHKKVKTWLRKWCQPVIGKGERPRLLQNICVWNYHQYNVGWKGWPRFFSSK